MVQFPIDNRLIRHKVGTLILFLLNIATAENASSSSTSTPLTKATFDNVTRNKTVFIKLFAPWCGHSMELAPHWERMADEWATNQKSNNDGPADKERLGLIAEIDCTQENEEAWCIELGVTGFPTLLYGDPSNGGIFLQEYNGDKTDDALTEFANSILSTAFCSPGNIDPCSSEDKTRFQEYWDTPLLELKARLEQRNAQIELVHKEFDSQFQVMQNEYNALAKKREVASLEVNRRLSILKHEQNVR